MQESKLRNIGHGDLAGPDSRGLFQQRPSQGWGTQEQVMDPVYATNAFYDALVKVPGYATAGHHRRRPAGPALRLPGGLRRARGDGPGLRLGPDRRDARRPGLHAPRTGHRRRPRRPAQGAGCRLRKHAHGGLRPNAGGRGQRTAMPGPWPTGRWQTPSNLRWNAWTWTESGGTGKPATGGRMHRAPAAGWSSPLPRPGPESATS